MINKLLKQSPRFLQSLKMSYGELTYTNKLQVQSEFGKVPTFRVIDLDGKLVNHEVKYNTEELVKILKTMIFVDEMDSILLKVKGQGIFCVTQEKFLST